MKVNLTQKKVKPINFEWEQYKQSILFLFFLAYDFDEYKIFFNLFSII